MGKENLLQKLVRWRNGVGSRTYELPASGMDLTVTQQPTVVPPLAEGGENIPETAEGVPGRRSGLRMLFARGSGTEESEMAAVKHNLDRVRQLPLDGIKD